MEIRRKLKIGMDTGIYVRNKERCLCWFLARRVIDLMMILENKSVIQEAKRSMVHN